MKKVIIVLLFIFFAGVEESFSQTPEYDLYASNFEINCDTGTSLEFDINIVNWNADTLEYAGGQFFLSFNPSIANEGTLTLSIVDSDLPAALQPRNPSIITASNPSATVMALAANLFPGPGNGYLIPLASAIRIARVKLTTTSTSFYGNDGVMNLQWRNSPITLSTKIYAYIGGGALPVDITTPETHYIEGTNCGHFVLQTMPWQCCQMNLLSLESAVEGLYDAATNMLNRKDTITVELRHYEFPYSVEASAKCRMDSINLSSFHALGGSFPPIFYLVLKHHNSIETWSKTIVSFPFLGSDVVTYNFLNSDSTAFGNNTKLKGTKYCLYSGDVNQDGVIDIVDMSMIDNDVYNIATGYLNTDLNGDYIVDATDVSIAESNAVNIVTVARPQ